MQVIEVTGYAVRSSIISMRRRRDGLRFELFPMMHVASPTFYRQVSARLAKCDLIVVEGIRGKSRQASMITLAYRFAPRASRGGLELQDYDTLLPAGIPVVNPDVTAEEAISQARRVLRWWYWPMMLLAPVFGLVFAVRGLRAFLDEDLVVEEEPLSNRAAWLKDDKLDEAFGGVRDRRVLDALSVIHSEHADEPMVVAVVYGAGHMPAIAAGLAQRHGYRPSDAEWLVVCIPD